ncbi:MAG TPA: Uma2 family endonuclease [Thermomicrobiales bacterium]|jgi:Uma2 family endonuclease
MLPKAKPVTVEELWKLRHEPYRLALIDGELYRMPGAGGTHGEVTVELCVCLKPFVAAHSLGALFAETGFRLFPDRMTTLFPDVAFVRAERVPKGQERERFLNLYPDLAIEIYSPRDYPKLLTEKIAAYLEAGTTLVWVLYPRTRSVVVHKLGEEPITLGPDAVLDGGEVLPGFSIRVGDLFP